MNLRALAARLLNEVVNRGRSLTDVLERDMPDDLDERDRALVHELCYGVCRWHPRLDLQAGALLDKPLRRQDRDIHCLLLTGLYQLTRMRLPAHAAVSETVAGARTLGKPWASKLINAVLRRFQREADAIDERLRENHEYASANPKWLVERLRAAWPDDWMAITDAANRRAPMTLRVNARQGSRDACLEALADAGIAARVAPGTDFGLILEKPVDVGALPGFATGRVSVQDGAAQLASQLLALQPGQRVLDACAAPGGKTAACLEQAPGIALTAIDNDEGRARRIRETLSRLNLEADLICADATRTSDWWDGQPFDRILLDAPCSATGVIRRHPDIKLLRRPGDINRLVSAQDALLRELWPLLAGGGMLLYATCSILPEENDDRISEFLKTHADARNAAVGADPGRASRHGRQVFPGDDDMDGFYYACLHKNDSTD